MPNVKPTFIAESMCVPGDANTMFVPVPRPMPCVVIFVHGVNSEGEWYHFAEQGLVTGLNDRLGRVDLTANEYSPDHRTFLDLKKSPVIRFYWGYRAPEDQTSTGTFPYKIPLRRRKAVFQRGGPSTYDYEPYSFKDKTNNKPGKYYWGGGPFQNGTTALNPFWYEGFNPEVLGGIFDAGSPMINPERDRPLNKSPKRSYYVNASLRLAKLIDSIYKRHPNDTVAVVSHSQGTMVAALAMLQVEHLPDALFLCNSPYCFEDKFLDGVAYGRKSPTQRSRIRTFFNILDRFKNSQGDCARKTTEWQLEGVGGRVKIATPQEAEGPTESSASEQNSPNTITQPAAEYPFSDTERWRPSIPMENPVPGREDHHNHGRVFVYCSPHDRVMGSKPLQSIGWKGVDYQLRESHHSNDWIKPFEKYKGVLFQRQFMRSHSVGGVPDQSDGPETPRHPNDGREFWIPKSPTTLGWINELTAVDKREKLYVNGPRVPKPLSAEEMKAFNEDINDDNTIAREADYKFYDELLDEKPTWLTDRNTTPYGHEQHQRTQTEQEVHEFMKHTAEIPTNHSRILMYRDGELVRRVLTYDLPIGRADSFDDRVFWKGLIKQADWLEEGSDPGYQSGGDFNPPKEPPDLNLETPETLEAAKRPVRPVYGSQ